MIGEPRVFVVTSEQSAARDAAAINAGVPSRALMQRAGAAAAAEIAWRFRDRLPRGTLVYTGPGNNGGDGWVIARALAAGGAPVRVVEAVGAKSADAISERALALSSVDVSSSWSDSGSGEAIIVDALLGTGSSGAPRGSIAIAVKAVNAARERGASVVAIDLPTGVDATTGSATDAVSADLTISFATIKRGHLLARQACGQIIVIDIGLGDYAIQNDGAPPVVTERWVAAHLPAIPADAHKGTRKKLAVVGGAPGMAGASILAARAAMRSGIGMVRLVVASESLSVVQSAEPFALAGVWPEKDEDVAHEIASWADGLVIGPGLGRTPATRALVDRLLAAFRGPVVLDADGLNVFEGRVDDLAHALAGRPALLTPHPAEFARLVGTDVEHVLTGRFVIGADLAKRSGATVLLKGVPSVVTMPNGEAGVSAAGTPVLAAAGSGDILSGIAGTLLTQLGDAGVAAATAAWVHGRSAELATQRLARAVRGATLEDVLEALSSSWPPSRVSMPRYPVLLELPAVGERS
jgi:NAD(P)H-hydrate epimerase